MCRACSLALPRLGSACPACALPSPAGQWCGRCLAHPPPQHATLAAFAYAFPVDRLLQRLKYGGRLALADWAADELAAVVAIERGDGLAVDALVPMALAPARQRARGFNQAQEIARRLAARLRVRVEPVLVRVRETAPQASLPWRARRANVRRAFACRGDVTGRHVALVDDVMTTGATVREAARSLRTAGAASVTVLAVARTLPGASGARAAATLTAREDGP